LYRGPRIAVADRPAAARLVPCPNILGDCIDGAEVC
jgi:hypothetical protein